MSLIILLLSLLVACVALRNKELKSHIACTSVFIYSVFYFHPAWFSLDLLFTLMLLGMSIALFWGMKSRKYKSNS